MRYWNNQLTTVILWFWTLLANTPLVSIWWVRIFILVIWLVTQGVGYFTFVELLNIDLLLKEVLKMMVQFCDSWSWSNPSAARYPISSLLLPPVCSVSGLSHLLLRAGISASVCSETAQLTSENLPPPAPQACFSPRPSPSWFTLQLSECQLWLKRKQQ